MRLASLRGVLLLCVALGWLSACGGDLDECDRSGPPETWPVNCSDGTPSPITDPGDPAVVNTLEVVLWDCPDPSSDALDSCVESNAFDALKPLVVQVTAQQGGAAAVGELVELSADKGTLVPADGRVLTDSDGTALLRLLAGEGDSVVQLDARFINVSETLYASINALDLGLTLSTDLTDGELLSAQSTITVSAALTVNEQPYLDPISVNFSSSCSQSGDAEIDAVVTAIDGIAMATYKPTGCVAQDVITATLELGSNSTTDSVTVALAETPASSIEYVSATPNYLQLDFTGGSTTSEIRFRIMDEVGAPKQGVDVSFALAIGEGKVDLSTESARSNSAGEVSVVLGARNIPGPVRVTATVVGSSPLITAVSQELRIGTGLPDKDSFSVSFGPYNPEAWKYDGVEVDVTVFAGDHFNNPVPDGTAISLIAEGGVVESGCTTVNGTCLVKWRSQGGEILRAEVPDARVSVVAFVEGEESFQDVNGNGVFDVGDYELIYDEHEVYLDVNEDGDYDAATEQFIDRDNDGSWNAGNGLYNGLLCTEAQETAGACVRDLVDLNDHGVIVLSGGAPSATLSFDAATGYASVCAVDISPNGSWNPLPYDTEITFDAEEGIDLIGTTSFNVRSTSAAIYHINEDGEVLIDQRSSCGLGRYGVLVEGEGVVQVEITLPDGTIVSDSVMATAP
ncbi:hypothetical protein [Ferrimonas pelagia]|uniref:Big-1 domain-containing protein n=1 Tax=Ferrimonas pelagia TaxID=1177826 RepID=A0ABP9E8X0_9GAMM